MEPFTILALILIFSTAIIFSPLGLGGGLIFMPILHYIMEWEIKTAILGSLILVWSVSLGSQFAHQKGGHERGLSLFQDSDLMKTIIDNGNTATSTDEDGLRGLSFDMI